MSEFILRTYALLQSLHLLMNTNLNKHGKTGSKHHPPQAHEFMQNASCWYTEPSYIKRLPDVGMVKVYPNCSEYRPGCYTDMNVDLS